MTHDLVGEIREHWGFTGIQPEAVGAVSPFGHVVIRDVGQAFWYLDPEMRTLTRIADDQEGLLAYMNKPEVREIWLAEALVARAHDLLGPPPPEHCYSLKPLAMLAGDYASNDFWHAPLWELIRFSGSMELQTKELPDGARYQIKVVD